VVVVVLEVEVATQPVVVEAETHHRQLPVKEIMVVMLCLRAVEAVAAVLHKQVETRQSQLVEVVETEKLLLFQAHLLLTQVVAAVAVAMLLK
jgi:hypothetical protein